MQLCLQALQISVSSKDQTKRFHFAESQTAYLGYVAILAGKSDRMPAGGSDHVCDFCSNLTMHVDFSPCSFLVLCI